MVVVMEENHSDESDIFLYWNNIWSIEYNCIHMFSDHVSILLARLSVMR